MQWTDFEMVLTLAFYKFDEHPQHKSRIKVFTDRMNSITKLNRPATSVDLRIANYVAVDDSNPSKGMTGGGQIVVDYYDKYVNNDPSLNILANIYAKFLNGESLNDILDNTKKANSHPVISKVISTVVYNRSEKVKNDTLMRANGKCERCGEKAPFITKEGKPYLEVHHLIPLSQGGKDDLTNTKALCPNCHRWYHYGV